MCSDESATFHAGELVDLDVALYRAYQHHRRLLCVLCHLHRRYLLVLNIRLVKRVVFVAKRALFDDGVLGKNEHVADGVHGQDVPGLGGECSFADILKDAGRDVEVPDGEVRLAAAVETVVGVVQRVYFPQLLRLRTCSDGAENALVGVEDVGLQGS